MALSLPALSVLLALMKLEIMIGMGWAEGAAGTRLMNTSMHIYIREPKGSTPPEGGKGVTAINSVSPRDYPGSYCQS